MAERQLPEFIAPFKLARQRQSLLGRLPLSGMPRLAEESQKGDAEVALEFGYDDMGVPHMRGKVVATVQQRCQRCMELMPLALDLNVELGFAMNDEQARQISAGYEPCVLSEDHVSLSELIEDEILLALPAVPMHKDDSCQPWLADNRAEQEQQAQEDKAERKNPFAVLAGMDFKKDK